MKAPEIDVLISDGECRPLKELYETRKLVLVFLRHLNCMFCKDQVAQLRLHPNLNVAFVCMSDPAKAEQYRKIFRSPHPFICDMNRVLYQAFGLGRGDGRQIFNMKTFSKGFGATLRGHWNGLPIGDPWQMPGVFAIEVNGEVSWEYRSVHAADNPSTPLIESHLTA